MIEIFIFKKKLSRRSIFLEIAFFFIISPLHFCLETQFFFQPENHVSFTFLSLNFFEKKSLFRSLHFCGKSVFLKKRRFFVRSIFGRNQNLKKKKNRSLAPFFSAENPSSIKLIWCGLSLLRVRIDFFGYTPRFAFLCTI